MPVDYIIDPSQSPSGNRYTSFATLAAAINLNRTSVNLGRPTEIRIDSNLTEAYSFSGWTTDSTNSVLIYGNTRTIEWRRSGTYSSCASIPSGKHVTIQDLTFNGLTSATGSNGIFLDSAVAKIQRIYFKDWSGTGAGIFHKQGNVYFCTFYNCRDGIQFSKYDAKEIRNCTFMKGVYGIRQYDSGNSGAVTITNCVCFGNSTSNWALNGTITLARNNAGASGDSIPDTVGSTSITVTSADFVDYTNNDFHITSSSKLRHTHASYPTGNNTYSGSTLDRDGETLPTYSTDADRWDTGSDYFVLIVLGTAYYIDANVSAASNSTAIKRASDNAAFTLNDMVAEDSLEIRSGAIVKFKDNGSTAYNFLKGIKVDVANGEFWLENALTAAGLTFFGIKGGQVKAGAQGKIVVRGALIQLADLSGGSYSSDRSLDNGEWDAVFGTGTKDSTSKYGEPAVLFVGASAGAAVPFLNEGSGTSVGDLANDSAHGRTFRFNPSNGTITWPNVVPATTEKVYCWNIMVHSQNGQGTVAQSAFFDTSAGGAIDAEKFHWTGAPTFLDANGLRLAGMGILQRLSVDHCSAVQLEVYQGISQANELLEMSEVKNLAGQASLGTFYGFSSGTVLRLSGLRSCTFSALWVNGVGAQSAGSYRLNIRDTDACGFGNVTVIDGGVGFDTGRSTDPVFTSLTLSNDNSGSNGNSAQHGLFCDATGLRGLKVNSLSLAASGQPTALDLVNLSGAGKCKILNITYSATVRTLLTAEASFDILVSGAVVQKFSLQAVKLTNKCRAITVQNVRATSTQASPGTFAEYSGEDIVLKNVVYENSARYTGWTLPVADLSFMEMNLGNGSTGILGLNFFRSSKGIFTLTGLAKSNNSDAVVLPTVSDRVEVEWPYDILVGSASPYFQNAAPTLVGTGTGNLTVEYAVNPNGAGYGSWKTLSGANLSGESLATKFRIKFRVTCATAGATNAIKQVILATNIDATVAYPATLVPVRIRGIASGSAYALYRGTPSLATELVKGTAPGGDVVISNVAYSVDETLNVVVRKYTGSPKYFPAQVQGILLDTGADITVSQVLDTIAV